MHKAGYSETPTIYQNIQRHSQEYRNLYYFVYSFTEFNYCLFNDAANNTEYGRGIYYVWGKSEVHTEFWWGNLRERNHFEDIGVDWRIILKWIFGL
jgi:hypothetical protein